MTEAPGVWRTSSTGASTSRTPTERASRAMIRPWRSMAAGSGDAAAWSAGGKRMPPAVRMALPHS